MYGELSVMSRREDRSSDARRRRSRFDREPSPKRSRRDDNKPERERLPVNTKLNNDRDSDKKNNRQLRDPPPLVSAPAHDSKIDTKTMNNDTDNRINEQPEIAKNTSDPAKVLLPRSYFQHDDRAGADQNGRAFNRSRTDKEHGSWRDHKEYKNDRTEVKKAMASDVKVEEPTDGREENRAWRHDGYFQTEANPARKRPAFREQKLPVAHSNKIEKTATDTKYLKIQDRRGAESERRDKRRLSSERSGRHERSSFARDRDLTKVEAWRNSRHRYGGDIRSGYGGREGFSGGQGYNLPVGVRVEKWKHDLYDEANKSPKAKNEEDQISKIEALLAS